MNNIWPVMILFSQTLPFCIFVTHCRFCKDCFIIFVCHLPYSIWYLARIFASILSDINKIQPVHRLSGSPFASLMCWKIILLCSRQLEESGIVIVNQCVRSLSTPHPLVISSNVILVRWQRTFLYQTEKSSGCIFLLSAQCHFLPELYISRLYLSNPGFPFSKFLGFITLVSVVFK